MPYEDEYSADLPAEADNEVLVPTTTAVSDLGTNLTNNLLRLAKRAPNKHYSASAPTVNNDVADTAGLGVKFRMFSVWVHEVSVGVYDFYLCVDSTATSANWSKLLVPSIITAGSTIWLDRFSGRVYGSPENPLTGDLTIDVSDVANSGAAAAMLLGTSLVWHEDSTVPSILGAAGATLEQHTTGSYETDTVNCLQVTYTSDNGIMLNYVSGSVTTLAPPDALTLVITESSIVEGGSATATVTRTGSTSGALTVNLSSDDTGEATVTATVDIPDGQSSETFTITGIGDSTVDGTQTVTISVSASGYSSGSDTIDITDVDTATLNLSIADSAISENGGTTTGTVTRNTDTTAELVVNLSSNDTGEATVPATVTIPASQPSATFTITGVDDVAADGSQTVTITASASGHVDGTDTLDVSDDDSGSPPVFTTDPVITSYTASVDAGHAALDVILPGEELTCGTGTATNSPTSHTYQWKLDGSDISGATTNKFTTPANLTYRKGQITCSVVASNAHGSSTPASTAIETVWDIEDIPLGSGSMRLVLADPAKCTFYSGSGETGSVVYRVQTQYPPTHEYIQNIVAQAPTMTANAVNGNAVFTFDYTTNDHFDQNGSAFDLGLLRNRSRGHVWVIGEDTNRFAGDSYHPLLTVRTSSGLGSMCQLNTRWSGNNTVQIGGRRTAGDTFVSCPTTPSNLAGYNLLEAELAFAEGKLRGWYDETSCGEVDFSSGAGNSEDNDSLGDQVGSNVNASLCFNGNIAAWCIMSPEVDLTDELRARVGHYLNAWCGKSHTLAEV